LVEAFELPIDCDAQRLKRARGWVDPPLFSADCAFDQLRKICGRVYRLAGFSSFDDSPGNAS
jgi:hypothetical protein